MAPETMVHAVAANCKDIGDKADTLKSGQLSRCRHVPGQGSLQTVSNSSAYRPLKHPVVVGSGSHVGHGKELFANEGVPCWI